MTITDEMIEAAARAIYAQCFHESERGEFSDAHWHRNEWPNETARCMRQARAALTAVAPLIARQVRAETVEECARIADEAADVRVTDFWTEGYCASALNVAANLRALTNEASHDGV